MVNLKLEWEKFFHRLPTIYIINCNEDPSIPASMAVTSVNYNDAGEFSVNSSRRFFSHKNYFDQPKSFQDLYNLGWREMWCTNASLAKKVAKAYNDWRAENNGFV